MSTIKDRVLSKIKETKSEATLEEVLAILEFHADDSVSAEFTDKQIQLLKQAQLEIEQGNSSTHDEVKGRIDQWLKE